MTGKDFEQLNQRLLDDGWKKSGMSIQSEDFHLYKGYEQYEDEYGDTAYRYQILVLFFDWRRIKGLQFENAESEVSVNVIVMPIDTIEDVSIDLHLSDFDSITGVERIASNYYEWVRRNFKCRDR